MKKQFEATRRLTQISTAIRRQSWDSNQADGFQLQSSFHFQAVRFHCYREKGWTMKLQGLEKPVIE